MTGNSSSHIHLLLRDRFECQKPCSFLQSYKLILWSVLPPSLFPFIFFLSFFTSFILYFLNVSERDCEICIKSHLSKFCLHFFKETPDVFTTSLCCIEKTFLIEGESSNKDHLFSTECILSWPTVTSMCWPMNSLKRWKMQALKYTVVFFYTAYSAQDSVLCSSCG